MQLLKVQIYDCKQVFYFEKFRKVPLGKFPPEKNSPENISDNFVKFFRQGNISENYEEIIQKILLKKNIILRL
jgi:hypothetical protein